MKQFEIENFVTSYNDLGNFFNVYTDENGKYYFSILKSVNFQNINSIAPGYYNEYVVKENDAWTTISYNLYGDINLWWIICKFNGIMNPIDLPTAGITLRVPTPELVKTIVDQMRNSI